MGWKSRTPYSKRETGEVAIGADELMTIAEILGFKLDEIAVFFTENVPD